MAKTFELTIKDGRKVIHTATANVGDDFEQELFDAYEMYYPGERAKGGDETLWLKIVRGLVEGVMANIAGAQRYQQPEMPVREFRIDGEPEPQPTVEEPEPQPIVEEEGNA